MTKNLWKIFVPMQHSQNIKQDRVKVGQGKELIYWKEILWTSSPTNFERAIIDSLNAVAFASLGILLYNHMCKVLVVKSLDIRVAATTFSWYTFICLKKTKSPLLQVAFQKTMRKGMKNKIHFYAMFLVFLFLSVCI